MSVEQFKEANQKLKYSNEGTSGSWPKIEATAEKAALVHVLSGLLASYLIRRAFLQHIGQRVSVESKTKY